MKDIIIICGPTASGKSEYSINLAKSIDGEIVSADSMQIYKRMNIGTAKMSNKDMQGITHHMIDIIEPDVSFSVSEYSDMAIDIINSIHNKNKTAIVVGGTGLYISSILYDLSYNNAAKDEALRDSLEKEYDSLGGEIMLSNIRQYNPTLADRLHANDKKRIVRALEVIKTGGDFSENEENLREEYNFKIIGLNYDRELLYANIDKRVDKMFDMGLVNEVNDLLKQGIDFNCQSFKAIGYKEFYNYFYNNESLTNIAELIKKNTRNYAKRQITWFKRYKSIKWINPLEKI